MKKFSNIILIIILLHFCSCKKSNITDNQLNILGYISVKNGLVLRESPSKKSKKILTIPFAEKVKIIKFSKHKDVHNNIRAKWAKVIYNKQSGWIFSAFITNQNLDFKNRRYHLGKIINKTEYAIDIEGLDLYKKIDLKEGIKEKFDFKIPYKSKVQVLQYAKFERDINCWDKVKIKYLNYIGWVDASLISDFKILENLNYSAPIKQIISSIPENIWIGCFFKEKVSYRDNWIGNIFKSHTSNCFGGDSGGPDPMEIMKTEYYDDKIIYYYYYLDSYNRIKDQYYIKAILYKKDLIREAKKPENKNSSIRVDTFAHEL